MNQDLIFAFVYIALILSFFYFWIKLYQHHKSDFMTFTDRCFFVLFFNVSIFAYLLLIGFFALLFHKCGYHSIGEFLFVCIYSIALFYPLILILSVLIVIILAIIYGLKKMKSKP
jgi:hypothetical protein